MRRPATSHDANGMQRLLAEPARAVDGLQSIAHHALAIAERVGPFVLASAALAAIVTLTTRRVRQRNLAANGRLIQVGVPPDVDPAGAVLLWSALHDLLRPRLARLLGGQPHLSWEITASERGTSFQIWAPDAVPPGLIERALTSAWPGASTTTEPATPDPPGAGAAACSELTLSGAGWFSLKTDIKPDPLSVILGQLAGLHGGQRGGRGAAAPPTRGRRRSAARRGREAAGHGARHRRAAPG